jgi:tripartite-type tricarboxylate transporter receptor subunit TctC
MHFSRIIVAAFLFATTGLCHAQADYPGKPVRIIIPYAAGGGVDAVARLVAKGLGSALGQNFIVEARPGGNTVIGAETVARSAPDGHTLLLSGGSTMTLLPLTQPRLSFNPLNDFVPIGQVSRVPFFLAVSSALPYKTARDLFEDPKTRDGSLGYASNGIGSMSHLGAEMLLQRAGAKMIHAPYNGFVPAISDLVSGRVIMMMADLGPLGGQLRGGSLRLLAVASPQRSPFMPEVPTLAEAGYPGAEFEVWLGLYAPAKTPHEIVTKLTTALNTVLATPAMRDEFAKLGQDASYADPDAARQRIVAEQKAFAPAARAANLIPKE